MNVQMHSPRRQSGIVTLWAVIFIIVGVMITLTQLYDIAGSRGTATGKQSDSTAALFVAESGLQRAIGSVMAAGIVSADMCTTAYLMTSGGTLQTSYPVGGGSFTLEAECLASDADSNCEQCRITSTGSVGAAASRKLQTTLTLNTGDEGAICNAATEDCQNLNSAEPDWSFTLANNSGSTAIGIFNLAAKRQSSTSGAVCPADYPGVCNMLWNLDAQNGGGSIGNMGNAVSINSPDSFTTFQQLIGGNYSIAEAGVLFRGAGTAPSLIPSGSYHAYWAQTQSGNPDGDGLGTGGKSNTSVGGVINGSDSTAGACQANDTASLTSLYLNASPQTPNKQLNTCNNWCYGGDTLVMGIALAPSAGTLTALPYDEGATNYSAGTLNSRIWFNTAGGYTPDGSKGTTIPLKRIITYPIESNASADVKATFPTDVVSELWYVHNPQYLSYLNAGVGDVFSGAKFTGYAGQTGTALFRGNIRRSGGSYYLRITSTTTGSASVATGVDYKIAWKDGIPYNNGNPTPTYSLLRLTTLPSPLLNTEVQVTINNNYLGLGNGETKEFSFGEPHNVLTVEGMWPSSPAIAAGDLLYDPTYNPDSFTAASYQIATIGAGNTLSTPPRLISSTTLLASGATNGTILTSPNGGGGVPTGDNLSTNILIAKKSGIGRLQSNTSIITSGATATTFNIDKAPVFPLSDAHVCGGTCAFFDHSATGARTTYFRIPYSAATNGYWAAGFICLSGANQLPLVVKSRTEILRKTWTEVVQ